MQSFLQYRRLRKEVQEDLGRAQQVEQSASSTLSNFAREPKEEEPKVEASGGVKPSEDDFQKLTQVPGVTVSRPDEGDGNVVFEVGWKENDPNNPLNWTLAKKWMAMLTCCALAIPLTMLTSIEGPTQDAFNTYYGVNAEAGSMTTGKISFACQQVWVPTDSHRHLSHRHRCGLAVLWALLRNLWPQCHLLQHHDCGPAVYHG